MSLMRVPPYVVIDKQRGQTPLEALRAWKDVHAEYTEIPIAYAGRLDPMAEGKLLVVLGEECKRMKSYTKLDKEYVVEVLFGFSTDTGDVLGMPHPAEGETRASKQFLANVRDALVRECGTHSRTYPTYSSKTVNGKPLFLYSLEGTLDSITIPQHIERIYGITLRGTKEYSLSEIENRLQESLAVVPRSDEPSKVLGADFRQDVIRDAWKKECDSLRETHSDMKFTVLTIRVVCGSGTYMRTLAERIGTALATRALALSIRRTKLGNYLPLGASGIWLKSY